MKTESLAQPKMPLTADQLRSLDPEFWTDERIAQQMAQWSYRAPSDPMERVLHAQRASAFEHEMRGLNFDLHSGRISEEVYQRLSDEAQQRHFPAES